MMDTRTQRFGKHYYRSNYMPHNGRQALEDRLHPPGISTSSNSSWTFSNSHDVPKPRKGRICGIFLIGAALVVALAVIAIAGLAFYIGGYSMEKHQVSHYQAKENLGVKRQYYSKESGGTNNPVSRNSARTPATADEAPEDSTNEFNGTKQLSSEVENQSVFVTSETSQQFEKESGENAKEETTEEMPRIYDDVTKPISQHTEEPEPDQSRSVTRNIEIIPKNSKKPSEMSEEFPTEDSSSLKAEHVQNGHARPTYSVIPKATTITTSALPTFNPFPPKRDYSDEPWRPIIPSYRDVISIGNPYRSDYSDKVFQRRYGAPIEHFTENSGPVPGFKEASLEKTKIFSNGMNKNYQSSKISDDLALKYKDLISERDPPPAEVVVEPDDIVTAPPSMTTDIVVLGDDTTSSTLFFSYNATKSVEEKSDANKNNHSVGVDHFMSGIGVIESSLEPVERETMTSKPETKTTPKDATIKAILHVADVEKAVVEKYPESESSSSLTTTTSKGLTVLSASSTARTTVAPSTSVAASDTSSTVRSRGNTTVTNPFLDDSRSASHFKFGLPDLPILKQFHNLDNLFKSFSKPDEPLMSDIPKFFVRNNDGNETIITRFPVRTKQTTSKSYRKDYETTEKMSTSTPEPTTNQKSITRNPIVIKGEVEVVSGPIKQGPRVGTTETPRLITLLPVRSNVNMLRPLRPRPKSNLNNTFVVTERRIPKMNSFFKSGDSDPGNRSKIIDSHPSTPSRNLYVDNKNGRRWIHYPAVKPTTVPPVKNEKLFIVTPQPKNGKGNESSETDKNAGSSRNLTMVPLYDTIETLLNLDYRNRDSNSSNSRFKGAHEKSQTNKKNTSEIVERIVKLMENIAISAGDSPTAIVKVNQTVVNRTTNPANAKNASATNNQDAGFPTKVFSSHYKLNQAGIPILTKVLNKAPSFKVGNVTNATATSLESSKGCGSIACGNGSCLLAWKKCHQILECPNGSSGKNCTCADHLKAQKLHRKLCDGIVDCWDFTDEHNCNWCKEEFVCSNSKMCIKKSQVCDGVNDCPFGDDERNCVTVSPGRKEAETFNYYSSGYLMVQKNGTWGKLCIDNFDFVSKKSKTGWKISDLGRSVCKALTFRDFDKVERIKSVPDQGRSNDSDEKYYELAYNEVPRSATPARDSVLVFRETKCDDKEVVKVTCTELECGLRPQAISQYSRIVGGGNAGPGSWPWQVALYKEGEFQCGGTLISENWLISAGHCFYHNRDAYWVARLGTLRTSLFLPSPYEQLRQISKIVIHPQYVHNGFINDISLLRMREPVRFTDYVRPICLPQAQASIIDNTVCTVVGWGQLSEVGWVFPDTLQEVQLPILSSGECRKKTLFLPLYKITDDMFCAGYDRGGRDACLGDSGGPLMCPETNGKWTLYGITSNGYGCARSNRPGVYTKVSKYLQWIHSEIDVHAKSVPVLREETDKTV